MRGSAPSVTHHAAFVQMETQRQYNLTQRREDKKKMLARPVIVKSYFGDDADVTGILIPPPPGEGDQRSWWRGTRRLSPSRGDAQSKPSANIISHKDAKTKRRYRPDPS